MVPSPHIFFPQKIFQEIETGWSWLCHFLGYLSECFSISSICFTMCFPRVCFEWICVVELWSQCSQNTVIVPTFSQCLCQHLHYTDTDCISFGISVCVYEFTVCMHSFFCVLCISVTLVTTLRRDFYQAIMPRRVKLHTKKETLNLPRCGSALCCFQTAEYPRHKNIQHTQSAHKQRKERCLTDIFRSTADTEHWGLSIRQVSKNHHSKAPTPCMCKCF